MKKEYNKTCAVLKNVSDYIAKTTGTAATQDELADALGRYFVLQEIKDHIELKRGGYMGENGSGS